MGWSTSARVFTQILKPVYATLRRKGHISTVYIDDSYLQGRTENECTQNILDTVHLLDCLGFTVHVHDKKKKKSLCQLQHRKLCLWALHKIKLSTLEQEGTGQLRRMRNI